MPALHNRNAHLVGQSTVFAESLLSGFITKGVMCVTGLVASLEGSGAIIQKPHLEWNDDILQPAE